MQYVPIELGAVRPQDEVRVRFTDETAVRLASEFGRITPQLEANLTPQGADSVEVSVWIGRDYVGTPFENARRTVAIARSDVVELRRKRLSVWRSALVGAGAVAVFAVIIDRVFFQEDPNPLPNGGGINPPPEGLVVLKVPIGW